MTSKTVDGAPASAEEDRSNLTQDDREWIVEQVNACHTVASEGIDGLDAKVAKLDDDAFDRIGALEEELAELRAFVPMLARLAFYERWAGKSIPEHIERIEDAMLCTARAAVDIAQGSIRPGSEHYDVEPVAEVEPELRRPDWTTTAEPLPTAALRLQEAYDRRNG